MCDREGLLLHVMFVHVHRKYALHVFHVALISYIFFKQQPNTWHNLSNLGQICFIQTRLKGRLYKADGICITDIPYFHKCCWHGVVLVHSSKDI